MRGWLHTSQAGSPSSSLNQELLSPPHPSEHCCVTQGYLHLFIEQQRCARPRGPSPLPFPCSAPLGSLGGPLVCIAAPLSGQKAAMSMSSSDSQALWGRQAVPIVLASVRAKWRLEPGAPGIPSGTLSLYGCLPRGWQGGWSPGSRAGGLFHPPTFPSLPRRELELLGTWGREGFRGPWVGVGHVALCS